MKTNYIILALTKYDYEESKDIINNLFKKNEKIFLNNNYNVCIVKLKKKGEIKKLYSHIDTKGILTFHIRQNDFISIIKNMYDKNILPINIKMSQYNSLMNAKKIDFLQETQSYRKKSDYTKEEYEVVLRNYLNSLEEADKVYNTKIEEITFEFGPENLDIYGESFTLSYKGLLTSRDSLISDHVINLLFSI